MQKYPKLLVISNECFSNVTSNGRTLRNFLVGWPKEKLAQFYIRDVWRDDVVCNRYYYVSDGAALRSFLRGKPARAQKQTSYTDLQNGDEIKTKEIPRNAISMMLRNIVWDSMRWAGREFVAWVDAYQPEVILLQAGDCAFMLRMARKIAQKYNIPLVIYNSEAYYFKKHDYFRSKGLAHWMYPLFHWHFCLEFRKTIKQAEKSIYCCDKLKEAYDVCFGLPSEVIYTSTEMKNAPEKVENVPVRVSYLGNLGVGRHEGLVEIANALQAVSPELKLDVYGKIPNAEVKKAFAKSRGIHYCGFVSYEEVKRIMWQSDILVHTESFLDFYREDLKYAFSTKIADSLGSGRCFLLYAPEDMACTEYLMKHNAAYVVVQKDDLQPVLKRLCDIPEDREKYIANAWNRVLNSHVLEKNTCRFQNALCENVKGEV